MKQRRRIYYSAVQRSEIWDRWQAPAHRWPGFSAELMPASGEREPASIGQVESLIGADVDAGRIHRLAVVERPAQIEAAIAGLRQFSQRLLAGFHRADHFLPVCRAGLGRLQLD